MDSFGKSITLLLILTVSISCLTLIIKPANAQTIPKPTIPQFSIKTTDHSYDIPPTYGIDQFTGQNITIHEGAHYQWRTLDFTIVNQQVSTGYGLYYNIRFKGQYTNSWTELYHAGTYISQQSGQYSTVPFHLSGSYPSSIIGDLYTLSIPAGATVDFQVQALAGTTTRGGTQFGSGDKFTGQTSDWSSTQSTTIPTTTISPNPTQSPTPSPTIPEFPYIIIVTIIMAVMALTISVFKRKAR
jgi:hypothetical protein